MARLLKYKVGQKPFYVDLKGGYISRGVVDKNITYVQLPANKGKTLSLFYNRKNNLVVGDIIDKNGKGGIEFLRKRL